MMEMIGMKTGMIWRTIGGMTTVAGWVTRDSLNHFEKEKIKKLKVFE